MSQAIVYHFNLCMEVMGAGLVPSPDGLLVAITLPLGCLFHGQ